MKFTEADQLYTTKGKLRTKTVLKRYTGLTYEEVADVYDFLERVAPTYKEYREYLDRLNQEEAENVNDLFENLADVYDEYYDQEEEQEDEEENPNDLVKNTRIETMINGDSRFMTIRDIKETVARYIPEAKWYFKYLVNINGYEKWQTIPINANNMGAIVSILNGKTALDIIANGENYAIGSDAEIYYNEQPLINSIQRISIDPYGVNKINDNYYKTVEGSFYPKYINTGNTELDEVLSKYLYRYQIFKDVITDRKEYDLNCFLYALKQSGKVSDEVIYNISLICTTRIVTASMIKSICEKHSIKLRLCEVDEGGKLKPRQYHNNELEGEPIELILIPMNTDNGERRGLYHYILNERVEGISAAFFKYYDKIDKEVMPMSEKVALMYEGGKLRKRARDCHINSYKLIELIAEKGWFTDMNSDDYYKINPYSPITSIRLESIDLSNIESDCICYEEDKPKTQAKKQAEKPARIYFADFESDITGTTHIPYAVAYTSYETEDEKDIKFIYGLGCDTKFVEQLEDGAIVYFHNLGYDARMFNYDKVEILSSIDKGNKIYSQKIRYKGKVIYLRDSLCLIPIKLAAFAASFGLSTECEKEMYPYSYYTIDNINKPGVIDEAGKDENPDKWNQEQFIKNVEKVCGCKTGPNTFSKYVYCRYYCCKDVHILKEGFKAFRNNFLQSFGIDVVETVSASSLAQKYFKKNVYDHIPDLWKYRGHTRAFIQAAIYGGRVMTRDNVKHHVSKELNDFDAVSLYPSAIKRLYVVKGKPRELTKDELNWEYLKANTCGENDNSKPIKAYIVEIDITKVGKALHFPLIVKRIYNGAGSVVKQMNLNECCSMVVDNILLEDLKQYQEIDCLIKRGICWTGEKDYSIRDEIEKLHQERCKYKGVNQSMSFIVKLIMNSAYGKTIQKPIDNKIVYKKMQVTKVNEQGETVTTHPAEKYLSKNFNKVNSCYKLCDNLVQINTMKTINDFAALNLIGVQILSMSKRIMNEVMTTAEANDIPIYYQDTDSMHIENDRIDELAKLFKAKYGRELIGKQLGQFHNDFDELGSNPVSIESYFLGKKAYIDKLTNDKGDQAYHIRLKGIPGRCIELKASEFGGDVMKVYKYLYERDEQGKSHELTFNLKEVLPCFRGTEARQMSNVSDMLRTVSF